MAGSQDFTTNGSNAAGRQQSGPSYTYDNQYKDDQGFQNRNSFGGIVGGADTNVNRYRQMGQDASQRSAYQGNYGDSNQVRGMQLGSLGLLDARARGLAPSAAEISGTSAMNTALGNQVAAAGSVRGGPMQQAAAVNAAANATSGRQAQMVAGIQAGRANEMATAAGQLVGAEQGTRQQDLDTQAQLQAADLAQRQLNQQSQQFYEGLGYNVNAAQLQANQNAQHEADAQGQANIQNAQQSSDFGWGKLKDVVGMVGGAASGGAGAALGAVATGGHVKHEQPYLVGEQGPELVIPKKDGWVLTAQQTAAMRGAPPTPQQIAAEPKLAYACGGYMPARALGGPLVPEGDFSVGNGMIMGRAGGLDIGASERATNAIDTQYMHHAGSNPVGPAGFTREDGGPIAAKEESAAEKLRRLGSRIAGSLTNAFVPPPAPIVVAPPHPPRAAVVATPHELAVTRNGTAQHPGATVTVLKPSVAGFPGNVATTAPAQSSVQYAPAAVSSAPVGMVSQPVVAAAVPARAAGGPMLGDYLDAERAKAPDPYYQPPETGVAGAPRGYAASRAGQQGYMFGEAPAVTHGYEPTDGKYAGQAPGTEDFARYGDASKDKDPDWKRGGATTPAGAGAQGGNWLSKLLLGMSGGLGAATAPRYGGGR